MTDLPHLRDDEKQELENILRSKPSRAVSLPTVSLRPASA